MNLTSFIKELFGILDTLKFRYNQYNECYIITIGKMYEAPKVNLDILIKLSKYFGTTQIDVDGYENEGCESCDWGSDYGHEIQIYNPVKHVEELKELI